MPSEIIRRSKFFIWFLFASCVLWASEFGRLQVLILTTKKFNGHPSNNFSTAEIRTFMYCILNSLTRPKEIIAVSRVSQRFVRSKVNIYLKELQSNLFIA